MPLNNADIIVAIMSDMTNKIKYHVYSCLIQFKIGYTITKNATIPINTKIKELDIIIDFSSLFLQSIKNLKIASSIKKEIHGTQNIDKVII